MNNLLRVKELTKKFKIKIFLSSIVIMTSFFGCAGTQSPVPMTKNIKSFKDYIEKKRVNETGNYDIIAEKSYQTILEYRTFNEQPSLADARDVMKILDDAKEYCQAIGGNGLYGDQAINELQKLPTSFSIGYVKYRNEMTRQGFGHYNGFYKCASAKDGFEIEYIKKYVALQQNNMIGGGTLKTYSRYFLVTHDNPQNTNSKFWLKSDNYKRFAMKNKLPKKLFTIDDTAQAPWKYEKFTGAQKYCSYNGGKLYIANAISSYKKMSIEDYYFTRSNQIKDTNSVNIFMDRDYLWCENQNNKAQEFTLIHDGPSIYFKQGVDKEYLETKGVSFEKIKPKTISFKTPSQIKETLLDKHNQNKRAVSKVEQDLATYTLLSKLDTYKSIGQIQYETSYNGSGSDGCEYASVIKRMMQSAQIENFKKCNDGQITYLGKTGVEKLTDDVQDQLKSIVKKMQISCKLQNQTITEINEFTFKCLKNPLNNSYKFVVLKDGKLINVALKE